jgi:hypothetical protein
VAQIEGLYLNFAVICERVLHETDGVLSIIRIVDQLVVSVATPPETDAPPELLSALPVGLTFAVGLKSAGYSGPVPVKVRIESPAGLTLPEFETTQQIGGTNRGLNLILPVQFPAQDEGVYWFVLEVAGKAVTRVPLLISKQAVPQTGPSQG